MPERNRTLLGAALAVVLAVLLLATAGLADAPAEAASGKVTLTSTRITGQNGKVLVVFLQAQGGGSQLARACGFLDSDSYAVPATVMTDMPEAGSPCDGETPETMLAAGSYTITAGIYVPGSQTAEKQVSVDVVVDGDKGVQLDGAGLSVAALGDVDCNGTITSVDALRILRFVANLTPVAPCIAAGDVNCSGEKDSVDALGVLRHVAGLPPPAAQPGCPDIGA